MQKEDRDQPNNNKDNNNAVTSLPPVVAMPGHRAASAPPLNGQNINSNLNLTNNNSNSTSTSIHSALSDIHLVIVEPLRTGDQRQVRSLDGAHIATPPGSTVAEPGASSWISPQSEEWHEDGTTTATATAAGTLVADSFVSPQQNTYDEDDDYQEPSPTAAQHARDHGHGHGHDGRVTRQNSGLTVKEETKLREFVTTHASTLFERKLPSDLVTHTHSQRQRL
jgi:hypothetical protein